MHRMGCFFALAPVLCFAPASLAHTMFQDGFESGVDNARWTNVTQYSGSKLMLADSTCIHSGTGAAMQPANSLYYMRSRPGLLGNIGPVVRDQKVTASVWFWDDGLDDLGGVSSFSGGIMLNNSALGDYFQVGIYNWFAAVPERLTHYGWRTKTDYWNATSIRRTAGWHELSIEVGAYTGTVGDVKFYIDGVLGGQGRRLSTTAGTGYDIDEVRVGVAAASSRTFWYDDLSVNFTPEPATAMLAAIALLALRPSRRLRRA